MDMFGQFEIISDVRRRLHVQNPGDTILRRRRRRRRTRVI
jgi:hypothetical protein